MSTKRVLERECEKRNLKFAFGKSNYRGTLCIVSNPIGVVYTVPGKDQEAAVINTLKILGLDPFLFDKLAYVEAIRMDKKRGEETHYAARAFDRCIGCRIFIFPSEDPALTGQLHNDCCPWADGESNDER